MKDRIDLKGFLIMVLLTALWGLNYPAVKIANVGFSPVFNSFLRSLIASVCGILYCLAIGQPLFHRDKRLFHGFMVGLLFGLEFVCIYWGLLYTDAARAVILVNFSPFVVVLGAFAFLHEKLSYAKICGIVLAFIGIYLVFWGKPKSWTPDMFYGDLLEILAAVFWGATTIYIKKYLAETVHPIHTFLYQLAFSVPVIFICACLLESRWILDVNPSAVVALGYSSVIVAFASYLAWFKLIHTYPVSDLAVLTFLSPVFGVVFGMLVLAEQLTLGLVLGLFFVCTGIYVTNYRRG
ncbi:MAG: DMT family transporter [Deltaproteobacteria bacterium]|nr:DMT family transporter [Deltaproteobacteria bacterium]